MAPVTRLLVGLSALLSVVTATAAPPHQRHHSNNHLSAWEQIHQTIHAYPLAIDFKDFGALDRVFTGDATANYTGPLSSLRGLAAIEQGLQASVATIATQHLLGTTLIDTGRVEPAFHGGARVGSQANSTTYFTASLFGQGKLQGEVVYLYGNYRDELRLTEQGWRIWKRQLEFMGPMLGNLAVIGQ